MRGAIIFTTASVALLAGCQMEDLYIYRNVPSSGPDAGFVDSGTPAGHGLVFESGTDVLDFLEGERLVMEGHAIPTHPNGYFENINFGQATQCIHRVTMEILGGNFRLSTVLGTLRNAPQPDDVGTCDRSAPDAELIFDSTVALVENVRDNGACFDITLTYSGFGQEGRGGVQPDGKTVFLELYFRDQAQGHRCAEGDVGASSVVLNQDSFTGNAVQTYTIRD